MLHTSFGQVWFWHLMLVLATCGATASPWRYPLLLMLSMAALLSLAFTGHAAMYDGLRGAALQPDAASLGGGGVVGGTVATVVNAALA
ncbi:MAG: hypothetical protein ACR5LH_15300 [Sodalis sp. (in: enterobacteria)]